jgi:hypothetical protein
MPFATENFTDTAGTNLTAHGGGVWSKHGSFTGDLVITDANRCRQNTSATSLYYHSASPATAEYDVQATVRSVAANDANTGVAARINTGANTCYFARHAGPSTNQWQLFKTENGTTTPLGTFNQTLTNGVDYVLKLEIRNATKKVFIDGVERISSTDNAITAAGKAGLRAGGTVVATDSSGFHLDDWSASDAGGGNTYNETMSGGIVIGGSAARQAVYNPSPSGGIVVGGSTAPQVTYNPSPSGGIVIGGSAAPQVTYSTTMTGGPVLGGDGAVQAVYSPAMSGGPVLGGSAAPQATYSVTASGGLVVGGSADPQAVYAVAMSGGLVLGGSWSVSSGAFVVGPAYATAGAAIVDGGLVGQVWIDGGLAGQVN